MARLSASVLIEKLKSPPNKPEIEQCRLHDKRCVFHTEPTQNLQAIPFINDYRNWVAQILDVKKQEVFNSLMKLPIETVDFTDGVFKELKKVFDGQNRVINYEFKQTNLVADFNEFLIDCNDNEFWQGRAFNAMKSAINSILIVDMPELEVDEDGQPIQETLYPEPYYYLLDIKNVIDYDFTNTNDFAWILFLGDEENEYYFFDDTAFTSFTWNKDKQTIENYVEMPHDLGYCPARSFWTTPFNKDSKIQKRSPISTSLTKLDWLLFTYISSKHLDLYAGFPIYLVYEQRCNYKDDDGNACDNGRISRQIRIPGTGQLPDTYQTQVEDCPTCKNKKLLGAGTVLTAPARADMTEPDLLHGVFVVPAEKESLSRMEASIQEQENTLIWRIAGTVQSVNKAAMNELQIASGYESRLTVLLNIAENFENANKWVVDTVAKLRYGDEFISSNVSYGNLFYLYTIDDLVKSLDSAKKAGVSEFELSNQMDQLFETKYQNNPEMIERCKILKAIEPWPGKTIPEMLDISKLTDLSDRLLNLKFSFNDYVERFELEFTNIVNFMPEADPKVKMSFIKTKLLSYVDLDIADIRKELASLPNAGVPRGQVRFTDPISFANTQSAAPGSGASGAPSSGGAGNP